MRWLGRALAGSLAVHAAIAVAASTWRHDETIVAVALDPDDPQNQIDVSTDPPPPPPAVPIQLVAIAPPPLPTPELPAPEPAPARDTTPRATPPAAARPAAPAQITNGTPPTPTAGPETPTPPGSRLFAMRDPIRRPDAAATGEVVEQIADQGERPATVATSGRIAQHGADHSIDDRTFTAQVDDDGTVHIKDKRNFHVNVALPSPKAIGRKLAEWAEDPYAYVAKLPQPGDAIETAPRGDRARINGTDQRPDQGETVQLLGGGFDLTDWVARKALGKAKGDPYAARKRAALDATLDERAEMRRVHRNEQLQHADQIVRDSIYRLWGSSASLADKKEGLFELWDDCAESGDAPVVKAATEARAQIVGFIRVKLPAGAAGAYTTDELAALNAHKTSHARFAPYAPQSAADVPAADVPATDSAPGATSP